MVIYTLHLAELVTINPSKGKLKCVGASLMSSLLPWLPPTYGKSMSKGKSMSMRLLVCLKCPFFCASVCFLPHYNTGGQEEGLGTRPLWNASIDLRRVTVTKQRSILDQQSKYHNIPMQVYCYSKSWSCMGDSLSVNIFVQFSTRQTQLVLCNSTCF